MDVKTRFLNDDLEEQILINLKVMLLKVKRKKYVNWSNLYMDWNKHQDNGTKCSKQKLENLNIRVVR